MIPPDSTKQSLSNRQFLKKNTTFQTQMNPVMAKKDCLIVHSIDNNSYQYDSIRFQSYWTKLAHLNSQILIKYRNMRKSHISDPNESSNGQKRLINSPLN
jgi:hypothetical protein